MKLFTSPKPNPGRVATPAHPGTRSTAAPGFRLFTASVALGTAMLLAGCQSAPPRVAHPRPVVVRDFAFDVAQHHGDSGRLEQRRGPVKRVVQSLHPEETPEEKAARFSALLSASIAKELTALNIPATRPEPGAVLSANALVVQGQFLEVDEGRRLRRAIVGFGAGSTEVLVEVSVFDLAQSAEQPAITFGTGHGSKPMPGAILMLNPYAMAARFVLSRNATEKDVRKLGKEIAEHLAQIESGAPPKP
jgi:hypothetical protein